jgi:hypothetical protein
MPMLNVCSVAVAQWVAIEHIATIINLDFVQSAQRSMKCSCVITSQRQNQFHFTLVLEIWTKITVSGSAYHHTTDLQVCAGCAQPLHVMLALTDKIAR